MIKLRWLKRPPRALTAVGALAVGLSACNLDVIDPDIVTPQDAADPASIPAVIAGMVGDFQLAFDDFARDAALFTDEFLLAGTFPTRQEVNQRQILVQNVTLNIDQWQKIHVNRFSADIAVDILLPLVGDPELDQEVIQRGVAFGQYYGAYARVMLAEMFCQSILGGGEPEAVNYEGSPIGPDERMSQALALFQQAQASATAAGEADLSEAAVVGQAHANMFLGNYSAAASAAAGVSPGFLFVSEYSSNVPAQYNEVYTLTYGDTEVIRYSVGDGTLATRNFERFPFYDEWVAVGLVNPDPGPAFLSFDRSVAVKLQTIYGGGNNPPSGVGQAASMIIASGFEADIIQAEVLYRNGDLAGAAALINSRITDSAANPHGKVFSPVAFTGTFATDIAEIGRAYLAGLWLTGNRLHFMRRVLRNDGVDLYPPLTDGSDTAFPVPQQELDNNPDMSASCPSGPPWS